METTGTEDRAALSLTLPHLMWSKVKQIPSLPLLLLHPKLNLLLRRLAGEEEREREREKKEGKSEGF